MKLLIDANVLLRLADGDSPQHGEAKAATQTLAGAGDELLICHQAEREFWVVTTRPRESNGLGLTPGEAQALLNDFGQLFALVPDVPEARDHWLGLVTTHGVRGKPAHDAGYVAVAQAYGLGGILTFNDGDFRRYASERFVVLTPGQAAARIEDLSTEQS